jgi:hypothetical protein
MQVAANNRHRGRRGEASTPRGGMGFGQVEHRMAGQFVSGLVWVLTTIVMGTRADSRPRGGLHLGMVRRVDVGHGPFC